MRNRYILIAYLALFFLVVSFYDAYKESELLVTLATAIILVGGLVAWVWSVQPRNDDK